MCCGSDCGAADYALLCVDAATGITRITREHLAVAVALEVPTALVVTKADAVDEQQLQQVLDQLHQLMQPVLHNYCRPEQPQILAQQQPQAQREVSTSSACQASSSSSEAGVAGPNRCARDSGGGSSGVPVVTSEQQAIALAAGLSELHSCTAAPAAPSFQQAVFPVFVVSCVTGAGIPLLHAFLSHLRPLQEHKQGSNSSSGAPGIAAAVQAGRTAAGSTTWARKGAAAASSQQRQGPAGLQLSSSSQLWGVSPKKHRPSSTPTSPTHPAAACIAAPAVTAGMQVEVQQSAGAPVQEAAVSAQAEDDECRPGHFQVVHTYDVEGVGWVVSGIAVTGG